MGDVCNQIEIARRASSTSPTTDNSEVDSSSSFHHHHHHHHSSAIRSSSFSKPFRGLKRILFGPNKSSEKISAVMEPQRPSFPQQQPQQQPPQPHASRSRRFGDMSSSDDEGVILSESYNSGDTGGSMEGVEGETIRQQRIGASGGPLFLPAFRHGRPGRGTNSSDPNSTVVPAASANNAVSSSNNNNNPSWSKVRHSSSHRSLSSQSSEKEEGYASSRASHGSRESIDLDSLTRGDISPMASAAAAPTNLLPSEAMKHRIAVRPKRRHAVTAASNGVTSSGQMADLPSLKEEPGYLSNAAYTPAPFVVNQQSIVNQQLAARKMPLSMNNAASNGATAILASNVITTASSSSSSSSAPKVMKQTSSSSSGGSSSPPVVIEFTTPTPPLGPKPSVVQRGIKLPGLEPAMLIGTNPLSHKPPTTTRPASSQLSSSSFTQPSQSSTATTPSSGVAPASTTDDELAKVFSRLRKVNPDEKPAAGVDSSSLNPPVVLRKTGHAILPDSEMDTIPAAYISNNSGATVDNGLLITKPNKPLILPKPPTPVKNRQTVCLASLPFSSLSQQQQQQSVVVDPENEQQHVPAPSSSHLHLQQSIAAVKLTPAAASTTTTPSFPKSTSLNFTTTTAAATTTPINTGSSSLLSNKQWSSHKTEKAPSPPTEIQSSRIVLHLNQQHQTSTNV